MMMTLNLCTYVRENPLNNIDPMGLFCESQGNMRFARDERSQLAAKVSYLPGFDR